MVPVETYMVQQGYFDIFFPTSFELLRDMYEHVMQVPLSRLGARGDSTRNSRWNKASNRSIEDQESSASPFTVRFGSNFFTPRADATGVTSEPEGAPQVFTNQDFMRRHADLDATRLQNGENPLLEYYRNVKVLF